MNKLILIISLLTINLNATIFIEGAVGSQGMKATPLNDIIDSANTSDVVAQKEAFNHTITYRYNFSYLITETWGAGLRYDGVATGDRPGEFNPQGQSFKWSQRLESKIIYLTTDYYLFVDEFLVTFGFGLGYAYSNTFINEYKDSTHTFWQDSKVEYEGKGFSYILDTTYSWVMFETLDIFVGIGYRYLPLGNMTAKKVEGNTTVSVGDPYRTLENSGAVDFNLTGVYVTMGLRAMF